jgi:hypothetical protein
VWQLGYTNTLIKYRHNVFNLHVYEPVSEQTAKAPAMMTYGRIVGFDPDGICRVYASTWIEARQEARNYIRKQAGAAPLAAWRFELLVDTPAGMRSAGSAEL